MKIAIVSSPNSANSHDLMRAAKSLGYDCQIFTLSDLSVDVSQLDEVEFFNYDVYIFRGYNRSYTLAQSLAGSLIRRQKVVLDGQLAAGFIPSKFNEALVYADHNIAHIATRLIASTDKLDELSDEITYPVVVKDVDSQKGQGVRLCSDSKELSREVSRNGKNIIIQDFIKMSYDIRVIIVGDEVIGAIRRDAADGDFRSNVSLGAAASPHQLTDEERNLAMRAHQALGYDVSGVDLAYDADGRLMVIETNITPEWQGFRSASGIDVAEKIIQYASSRR